MRTRDEALELIQHNHFKVDELFKGIQELEGIIKKHRHEVHILIEEREVLYREVVKLNSK